VVGPASLRFIGAAELTQYLKEAGFAHHNCYGDWDRSPVAAQSPELIVIAQL
jgi:hypothetical protein